MSEQQHKRDTVQEDSLMETLDAAQLERMPLVASLSNYYGIGYAELLQEFEQKEL